MTTGEEQFRPAPLPKRVPGAALAEGRRTVPVPDAWRVRGQDVGDTHAGRVSR